MKNRKLYSSPESISVEIRQEGLLAQSAQETTKVTFRLDVIDDFESSVKYDLNSSEYRSKLWDE